MTLNRNVAEIVESVIHSRRSVRRFLEKRIERETLDRLVRAGIAAPSGSNWQNQRFLIIDDASEIERIGRARYVWPYSGADHSKMQSLNSSGIIGGAAALIIVFSDSYESDRRGNGEYHIWQNLEVQNCSASIENMLLMATAVGLGSCWVSASDVMNYTRLLGGQSWKSVLGSYDIPNWYHLQGIVILGYPRARDVDGFAKGEAMHGATVWQSTARKPMPHFLIRKRRFAEDVPLPLFDRLFLRILSGLIRVLLRVVKKADIQIHRLEVEKRFGKSADEGSI